MDHLVEFGQMVLEIEETSSSENEEDNNVNLFRTTPENNYYRPRPDLFSSAVQESEDHDDFYNVQKDENDQWPRSVDFYSKLEADSAYQMMREKFDSLDLLLRSGNPTELQKFEHQKVKKMMHLGRLVSHYHLDSEKSLENFFKYGCYCFNGEMANGEALGLHKGQGSPKDPIDRACRDYDQCVKVGLESFWVI